MREKDKWIKSGEEDAFDYHLRTLTFFSTFCFFDSRIADRKVKKKETEKLIVQTPLQKKKKKR